MMRTNEKSSSALKGRWTSSKDSGKSPNNVNARRMLLLESEGDNVKRCEKYRGERRDL